jgi:hypothetical protein
MVAYHKTSSHPAAYSFLYTLYKEKRYSALFLRIWDQFQGVPEVISYGPSETATRMIE